MKEATDSPASTTGSGRLEMAPPSALGGSATVPSSLPCMVACRPGKLRSRPCSCSLAQSNADRRSHARQRNVRRASTFESGSVTTTI